MNQSHSNHTSTRKQKPKKRRLVTAIIATVLVVQGAVGVAHYLSHRGTPGSKVPVPSWVRQDLLPKNPHSRPGSALKKIQGVVIHYVANPGSSAQANRNYFANLSITRETYASSHYVVGLEGEILQCIPLSEIAYCSNSRNEDTIAIEVCHPDESGKFTDASYDSVVKLTAYLCQQLKLDSSQVIRHHDVTGKICPKYFVEQPQAWDAFLSDVQAAMENPIAP